MIKELDRFFNERDGMADFEREIFVDDLKRVVDEYFECDERPTLEITKTDTGTLVCVLITARRVKTLKRVR